MNLLESDKVNDFEDKNIKSFLRTGKKDDKWSSGGWD